VAIHRVIYISRVVRQVRFADVEAIAQSAVARNTASGLTGLLLYTPSHFIQVIEGEEAKVNATVARIELDPRHSDMRVVDSREVSEREFDAWAMVARQLPALKQDLDQLKVERALELLRAARDA
jgi:hypothetical protein